MSVMGDEVIEEKLIFFSFIGFITKEKIYPSSYETTDKETLKDTPAVVSLDVYKVFILDVRSLEEQREPKDLGLQRSRQIMIQFLYRKKDCVSSEKFLLFVHQECKCI
jgi:hypothetical protein